jgi:hypothetical protein
MDDDGVTTIELSSIIFDDDIISTFGVEAVASIAIISDEEGIMSFDDESDVILLTRIAKVKKIIDEFIIFFVSVLY